MKPTTEQLEQILGNAPIKDWTHYCTRNRQYIKRDGNTDMLFVHTKEGSVPLSNRPYWLEPRERLEEILALRKRVQELEAQVPKWISVEDRLPDTCAYGLYGTLVDVSDIVATNQGAAVFFDGYWCEVGWDTHDLGKRIQGVTHWMPLPKL